MTHSELNQYLASARQAPLETSVEEVDAWVGKFAAKTAAGLGILALAKLIFVKNTLLMSITLGVIATISLTIVSMSSGSITPETTSTKATIEAPSDRTLNEHQAASNLAFLEDDAFNSETTTESTTRSVVTVVPEKNNSTSSIQPHYSSLAINELQPLLLMRANLLDDAIISYTTNAKKPSGKGKGIVGNGNVVKQDRAITPFQKLKIDGVFDVEITQGSEDAVSVETDENIQEYIVTSNEGTTLVLSTSENIKKTTKLIVKVTVKDLTEIECDGVGDISTSNALKTNDFKATINGVGKVSLNINCTNLRVNAEGVGDVKLKGTAKNSVFDVNGVGDLHAYDMEVDDLKLNHNAVGKAQVNAKTSLKIKYAGVGDIYYTGNATVEKLLSDGIGTIQKMK